MGTLNYDQLYKIFYQGSPDDFIGMIENQYLDSKEQPYIFKSEETKHEFAKDIVSFLNSDGGFILIGGKCERAKNEPIEQIVELAWFPSHLMNQQQYYDLIKEWIYPVPEGIEIRRFCGCGGASDKILAVIAVPKQADGRHPFLICKTVIDADCKADTFIVGYSQRLRDTTYRIDRTDIHKWFQTGKLFEEKMLERFEGLAALIEREPVATSKEAPPLNEQEISTRIKSAVAHLEAEGCRYLTLVLYPSNRTALTEIFQSRRSPIANLMANPPELRANGWGIECGLNPRNITGDVLRSGESERRVLDVYPDGMVVFVALINEDLLAWGSERGSRLHPLALAETVWGICSFYRELGKLMSAEPILVKCHLELSNLFDGGVAAMLPPNGVDSFDFKYGTSDRKAQSDEFRQLIETDWTAFTPETVGYSIIRAIYLWFGFAEDDIPYVKLTDDRKSLDTDAMIRPVR